MPWSDVNPEFTLLIAPVGLALLVYAAVGEPLVNRWLYRRLERRRVRDRRALTRTYLIAMAVHAVWILAVVAAIVLSPGVAFGDLGLRVPHNLIPLIGAVLAFAAAIGVAFLLPLLRGSRAPTGPPDQLGPPEGYSPPEEYGPPDNGAHTQAFPPPADPYGAPPGAEPHGAATQTFSPSTERHDEDDSAQGEVLAPRTRSERRMSFLATIVAAIAEELLYRGFLVTFGVSMGLPLWIVAPVSCVLYAVGHIYQGWRGLLGPGLLGVLYMVLYLGTGSLVVAIVAHVLLGVSLLLMTGKGRRHRAP
ncbi:CPBP family intramembrane metalloprotease [Spiractinospora alimapuensis]|uniref:CPBP family intramembrane glutamic endopeptidase n=1 Tax=Spiractinospora alimapuensis TaxID=2820884 RepID=UPI001F4624FF|nr:CPBP family intramembrane glutamic endopeptidase [Spiractinospora alimapuensis]QVQ54281.1 CPBP family intramembrane metalloprotease [Spiractinospora alimapuensis]